LSLADVLIFILHANFTEMLLEFNAAKHTVVKLITPGR